MSAVPNNGVVVRGLCVVRTSQYRRASPWRTVISLLLQDPSDEVDEWHHLTVTDASGTVVARRRSERQNAAQNEKRGAKTTPGRPFWGRPGVHNLVVGTGVDPVTYRFSGGRSAN